MCKKWYQLITCTEPVGALNRRSFFMPKAPYPTHGCGAFFVTACLGKSAGCRLEMRQISITLASNRHLSAGFCRYSDVFCRSMARNGAKSTFFLQVFESFLQVFCRLLVGNASD